VNRYKVTIIAPTCFYYQVALFRELASHPQIDLMVYFCSDESILSKDVVTSYKTDRQWEVDDDLLAGYPHRFLKNYSPMPSYLRWPVGLINLGIWNEIRRERPDVVVLMSWMNPTWWIAILACLSAKIPFLYMTDANVQAEQLKKMWRIWPKKILLGQVIFRLASGFLCSGISNQQLYRSYGVPEEKLFPFAYSWGYKSLLEVSPQLRARRDLIRTELGLPKKSFIVLYCGRLSSEKDPMRLLQAFQRVSLPNKLLIVIGDGQLKHEMQEYATEQGLTSALFYGFQNRREIIKFFAISDVLVLPSQKETWGIVINEAMCFGLPIIASDQVGANADLLTHGYNGFIFPTGDTGALSNQIERVARMTPDERSALGARSLDMIQMWLQRDLPETLVKYCRTLLPQEQEIPGHGL